MDYTRCPDCDTKLEGDVDGDQFCPNCGWPDLDDLPAEG